MYKVFLKIISLLLFIIHIAVTLFVLFGWWLPEVRIIYQGMVFATIASWLLFGGCCITKWQYYIEKKINPKTQIYEYGFIDYYLRSLFSGAARIKYIEAIGLVFLACIFGWSFFL